MSLRIKLPLAFMLALVTMALVALFGLWKMKGAADVLAIDVQQANANELAVMDLAVRFKGQVQEWKDTLLRGKDPEKLAKYWAAFQKKESDVQAQSAALRKGLPEGDSRRLVDQFADAHKSMGEKYRAGFAAFEKADHDPSAGDAAVAGMDRAPTQLLLDATKQIHADALAASEAANLQTQHAISVSWIGILSVMLVSAALGLKFSSTIVAPVGQAKATAMAIADGDLSHAIAVVGEDEVAHLMQALESMRTSLSRVVLTVRQGAEGVASASSQIAQGNQDLSTRTESQASALEETAASMDELGATVRHNADNANMANQLANSASGAAEQGGEVVNEVVVTMRGINESSKRIADIIAVIDGIAFQTNILALNAAVEAARAGEQGRGFAVVAGEVRSLASRSAEAAKEIKALISDSVGRVDHGSILVDKAGVSMTAIVSSIQRVTDIVGEISSASREQSAGVSQVGQAVTEMDRATQQNAAMVEQMAAAASSLNTQAQELVRAVSIFKLAQDSGSA